MLPFWRLALVVDDSATAAHIILKMLERLGFTDVSVRHSAEQGFLELQRGRYAFAIIDIEMRPINGLKMLDRIRRSKTIWNTPVLLTTASPMSTPPEQLNSRIAATSFILKPFSTVDLKRKLSEMPEQVSTKQELLPSEMAKRYQEWAPSAKRRNWESTLLTRIRRSEMNAAKPEEPVAAIRD